MIITYRITCHEADRYFKLCRSDGKKPTVSGLMDYVKANREGRRRYAGAFGYEMLQGRKKTA